MDETDAEQEPVKKEPWVAPEVARISAGAAELGPNPFAPEGSFGDAS